MKSMVEKIMYFGITAFVGGVSVVAWFLIKKMISNFTKQVGILFTKIDSLIANLQAIDKIVTLMENKITMLEQKNQVIIDLEERLREMEIKVANIETVCAFKGNKV